MKYFIAYRIGNGEIQIDEQTDRANWIVTIDHLRTQPDTEVIHFWAEPEEEE